MDYDLMTNVALVVGAIAAATSVLALLVGIYRATHR